MISCNLLYLNCHSVISLFNIWSFNSCSFTIIESFLCSLYNFSAWTSYRETINIEWWWTTIC